MGGWKEMVHVGATIDSQAVQQSLSKKPRASPRKKAEAGAYRPLVTLRMVYQSQV